MKTALASRVLAGLVALGAVAAGPGVARANHLILCEDSKCLDDATSIGSLDVKTLVAPYTIVALYSEQLGELQYIRLKRNPNDDARLRPPLAGSVITVRRRDVVKRFVIPSDPPPGLAPGREVVLATTDDFWAGESPAPNPPDYVLPVRFLPTAGGTIDIDGLDAVPLSGSAIRAQSSKPTQHSMCFL